MTNDNWRVERFAEDRSLTLLASGVTRAVAEAIAGFRSDARPLLLASSDGKYELYPPFDGPGWQLVEVIQPDGGSISPLHEGRLPEDVARMLAATRPNPQSLMLVDPEGNYSAYQKTRDWSDREVWT